ncbi:hypothetical protein ElyMa_005983300 [Elysia marginata]|uniref:Uncharacterized protein n=1 Tax=Elysia marginata TaxID=1093978 RepID=A0AAV4GE41_9GAST|nr:hypothetical protein ElyMa_005983300 [Elysia marginata]
MSRRDNRRVEADTTETREIREPGQVDVSRQIEISPLQVAFATRENRYNRATYVATAATLLKPLKISCWKALTSPIQRNALYYPWNSW